MSLLDGAEQGLLEVASVFEDGWTIDAAAQVAGLKEDTALELSEALAQRSLTYVDSGPGARSRMLGTIRAFVAEKLAARPDAAQIQRRHADYYRALAEQAGPALPVPGHGRWLERLDADAGNLAAAVRWYLSHDRGPLPHLLRVLWPFWFLRDHMNEARIWTDRLLPTADSLDTPARAELLCTVVMIALELGDDSTALAARPRLAAMQDEIGDPLLRAIAQLAIAWASPITGDFDSSLLAVSAALEELRSQREPLWTALAAGSLAWQEASAGRIDDALRYLQEVRDLGDQLDSAWLAAWAREWMGILAIAQGRLDQARVILDDALALSVTAHSTDSVTRCLIAFARLALAGGDHERAALLVGAAEGMRRRAGLRAWPILRNGEADLSGQISQALGPDRFSEMTQAGSRLSRQEAVAAVSPQHGVELVSPTPAGYADG
jgi:hypothetical protein